MEDDGSKSPLGAPEDLDSCFPDISNDEQESDVSELEDGSYPASDLSRTFFTAKDSGVSSNESTNDSKSAEDLEIIQTNADLQTKIENDRSKRFDFLLRQAEIYGHFMKPAYEEALTFSGEGALVLKKGNATKGSKNSTQELPTGAKVPKNQPKKIVTHFETTPPFIQGGSMRDYQVRGLNWLISLYDQGISGILADEMGLGKTIQSIALLGYLKHHRGINGPHLVIAPKSTLPNWLNEVKRWCPTLKAVCLIGGKDDRRNFIKKSFLPKRWNICITSYEMARIEKSTLAKVNYHCIVIDEAQKIKNENSLLSMCVRQLKSSTRLLLTGTPLQNNLHELWALLNFVLPDVFTSSEDFDSWFSESNFVGDQNLIQRLHAVLRPFLLRRIKSDVEKTLPPKSEMCLYVHLTPMQKEWYKKLLMADIDIISDKTGKVRKMRLLNILMHLRKVCNHPYLFEGAEPRPFTTGSHIVTNSGKMIVLDKLLMKLKAQNSRVLLFSQFTSMLDILEDYCIWREFEYCRLDGSTEYDVRQEDIDAFNAPDGTKFIYLLSTRAGGLGINLTAANIVIIYDSDWNPQVDLQAMDRAHRIGQTKEVKVFRFVAQDTAEEKIVERAVAKLNLDKMVIQQGRLVGSEPKGPTNVEVLNVVRFGAEKILKSDNDNGITDADIDTILAQSKIRSEEFDRRLVKMNEEDLKNLTIEQVEFDCTSSAESSGRDTFNFEGKNYRELRKRKHAEDNIIAGKRRKELCQSAIEESDDEGTVVESVVSDPKDASFDIATSDNESIASEANLLPTQAAKSVNRKPVKPQDFHFCAPYIWELYWQEMDYYHRKSPSYTLNLPEDLSLKETMLLKSSETSRLQNSENLNGVASREKQILKHEGFSSWKKAHFDQLIDAMVLHGPDNLEAVANAVIGKKVEDVVSYSQVFWLRCQELFNFEEIMERLNRKDLIADRRKAQQNLLNEKIKAAKNLADVEIVYEPKHWIGKRFSSEDDVKLLIRLSEIGLQTADAFGVLHSSLLESNENSYSSFLRTRTREELHARFNLLIHMMEKESSSQKNFESNWIEDKVPLKEIAIPRNIVIANEDQQAGQSPLRTLSKSKKGKKADT